MRALDEQDVGEVPNMLMRSVNDENRMIRESNITAKEISGTSPAEGITPSMMVELLSRVELVSFQMLT